MFLSDEIVNAAIKQRMEKDVDEVSKVARFIKSKIEGLDKEVSNINFHLLSLVLVCFFWLQYIFLILQNLSNRSKPGCGKGSAVDRSRTATTV